MWFIANIIDAKVITIPDSREQQPKCPTNRIRSRLPSVHFRLIHHILQSNRRLTDLLPTTLFPINILHDCF